MRLTGSERRLPSLIAHTPETLDFQFYEWTDSSEETQYVVQVPKQRNPFVQQFMRGFYLLWSLALFSVLVVGLRALGFSIASTAVFILFLCLIIATGVKVHNRSKEISMEEDKATFLTLLYDLIAVPFAVVGKHVIAGLSR